MMVINIIRCKSLLNYKIKINPSDFNNNNSLIIFEYGENNLRQEADTRKVLYNKTKEISIKKTRTSKN